MNRIIEKPFLIFWILIPLIILNGLLNSNEMLNINIHDTYFVFSQADLTILISILFGIIGLGYWILLKINRKLSKWLNLIHIVLTFGGILLIWILAQLYSESIIEFEFNQNLNLAMFLVFLLVTFGQIIYLINLSIALIKKRNATSG